MAKLLKRLGSLALAILMVASLLPLNVFAETTTEETAAEATEPSVVEVATLAELQEALAADNDLPILITKQIEIAADENVTLELNGKTVNAVMNGTSTTNHIYAISNNGDLTITDSKGNGSINSRGIYNYGELTLETGTINAIDGNGGYAVNNEPGATFVMNGGTLAATYEDGDAPGVGTDATALDVPSGCTATLNGGKIVNVPNYTFAIMVGGELIVPEASTVVVEGVHGAVCVSGGTATIDAGSFSMTGTAATTDSLIYVPSGTVTINGGSFDVSQTLSSSGRIIGAYNSGKATVNGGTFTSNGWFDFADSAVDNVTVNGATCVNCDDTVKAYVAANKSITLNGETYTNVVKEKIAEVDGVQYTDLQEAIDAADGKTVTLLTDVALTAPVTIASGMDVTIDLAGYTVSYDSTVQGEAMISNKGTLTINDTVGDGEIYYNYTGAADSTYGIGNYTIDNAGTLTVNGGKIYIANLRAHAKYPINNNSTTGDAICVINGGHLYNYNTSAIRQFCNSTTYKNSVTIKGGLVEGYCAVWMQNPGSKTVNGSLSITGGEIKTTAAAYVNGTAALDEVASRIYCTTEGGAWSEDSAVSITGGTINENVDLAEEAPAALTCEGATFNGYVNLPAVETGLAGSGTEADPFLIETLEDLILFRDSVNAGETKYNAPGVYVALANSIDLASVANWEPIGNWDYTYMGNFNGNGNTIFNLTVTGTAYLGLFGITEGTETAENVIENLVIKNVTVTGTGDIVAAAIAYPYYTTVKNITVSGDIAIEGGNYTAGVIAYTRRCVNASDLTVSGNAGSYITGKQAVGGVVSDIQMNGGLTANYSNFSASGLTITGTKMVGGISGIIAAQTLNGATVENVTLVGTDSRVGTVSGCLGGTATITNVSVTNVTGATAVIGGAYDGGAAVQAVANDTYYQTLEAALAATSAGDTITLLTPYVVDAGETVTIDLAGKTVSMVDASGATVAMIENKGTLVIEDSVGGGKLTFATTTPGGQSYASNTITNRGTLTINDGIIENTTVGGSACYALDCYAGSTTTVNGGKLSAVATAVRVFNWSSDPAVLNIAGGEIVAEKGYGINLNLGNKPAVELNITGGTVTTNDTTYNLAVYAYMTNSDAYSAENVKLKVSGGTLNGNLALNGKLSGSIAEGNVSVSGGTMDGVICYAAPAYGFISGGTFKTAVAAEFCAEGYIPTENADGTYGIVAALPEVVITDIKGDLTDSDPDMTFALNFAIKDLEDLTDEYLEALMATYGSHYVDYVLTIKGLTDESVTFNANGGADGYLGGQYDAWSENWVCVPFEDVTMKNGESLYIMEYAAKLMGQSGLRYTLAEVAAIVQNFDCGVYFTPEFLNANPNMVVTLELKVFTEDAEGNKIEDISVATNEFKNEYEAIVVDTNKQTHYFTTLEAAVAAAEAGETVILLAPAVIEAGETLTLDKDITVTYTSDVAGEDMITNKGILVIDGATVVYTNTDTTASNVTVSTISCEPGSVLTVNSGVVKNDSANNAASGIYAYAIDLLTNGSLGDVTATINGGEIISTNYMAIRQFNNGEACENTLEVTGGYIYGAKRAIQVHLKNNAAHTTITGGTVEGGEYALCFLTTSENLSVEGGTFKGSVWYSGTDGFISGGIFDKPVAEAYCAEGYIPTENADGTYGVKKGAYVAQIGDIRYESLAEAVAAAAEGNTIILLTNVSAAEVTVIDKTVTLDLNGKTVENTGTGWVLKIDGNSTVTLVDNSAEQTGTVKGAKGINVVQGSKLIMESGNITASGSTGAAIQVYGSEAVVNGGTVTAAYGAVLIYSNNDVRGTFTMNGGKLSSAAPVIYANGSEAYDNVDVTINGGEIVGEDIAIFWPAAGKLTINGGSITGATAVYVKSGSLEITGGTLTANGEKKDYAYKTSGAVTTGDALVIENVGGTSGYEAVEAVSITGGTFTSANAAAVASYAADDATAVSEFIIGGTFSEKVALAYCAPGYLPTTKADANGYYTVKKYDIIVSGYGRAYGYDDLQTAITNCPKYYTVTLFKSFEGVLSVYTTQKFATDGITIDLNGNTITGNITVDDNSEVFNLKLVNGTITGSITAMDNVNLTNATVTGNVTVSAGTFTMKDDAKVDGSITVDGTGALKKAVAGENVTGSISASYYVLDYNRNVFGYYGSEDTANNAVSDYSGYTVLAMTVATPEPVIVASYNGKEFTSLQDAATATLKYKVLKLEANYSGKEGEVLEIARSITLDLNGMKLEGVTIKMASNATLTVKDSSTETTGSLDNVAIVGNVTLNGAKVGIVTVTNGIFNVKSGTIAEITVGVGGVLKGTYNGPKYKAYNGETFDGVTKVIAPACVWNYGSAKITAYYGTLEAAQTEASKYRGYTARELS